MTNTERISANHQNEVRTASYVGLVRRRKGSKELEVCLGLAGPTEMYPAHWGLPGGGSSQRLKIRIPPRSGHQSYFEVVEEEGEKKPRNSLMQQLKGSMLLPIPETPEETAQREFGEETRRRIWRKRMQLALVVITKNPLDVSQSQQAHVFSARFRRILDREPKKSDEMQGFKWFTLKEAVELAAGGEIIDVNVLLGMQAVMESYLIHQHHFLKRNRVKETDPRLKVYGIMTNTDTFMKEMEEQINGKRRIIQLPPLSDSVEL